MSMQDNEKKLSVNGWFQKDLSQSQWELVDSLIDDYILGRDSSDVVESLKEIEDQVLALNPTLWPFVKERLKKRIDEPGYELLKAQLENKL